MSMMQLGKIRPAVLKLLVITTETPSRTAALFLIMILKARSKSKSVEFSDLLFAPQEPESSFFRRLSSETGIREDRDPELCEYLCTIEVIIYSIYLTNIYFIYHYICSNILAINIKSGHMNFLTMVSIEYS